MPNIALQIEYDGTSYHGFQKQFSLPTVQHELELAISKIANESIVINCAGRTDAGVHATAQVINFKTTANRGLYNWILGVNRYLPQNIAIKNSWIMPEDFHARFSAKSRTYRYIILNTPQRSGLWHHKILHYPKKLNHELMHEAAQALLGEHDFAAFRGSECQAATTMRCINFCNIVREGDFIYIHIQANAFLMHMVRNIVGTLIPIGTEQKEVNSIKEVLLSKNRCYAGMTVSPHGLYLSGVEYDIPKLSIQF